MAATRDKLIHDYFGVDYVLVRDIVQNEMPQLKQAIDAILSQERWLLAGHGISA